MKGSHQHDRSVRDKEADLSPRLLEHPITERGVGCSGLGEEMDVLPVREGDTTHKCRCLLIDGDEKVRCDQSVDSPDEPFCGICEGRHPDVGGGVVVTAWLD